MKRQTGAAALALIGTGVAVAGRYLNEALADLLEREFERGYEYAKQHSQESCGYCGVPPKHWPWCPQFEDEQFDNLLRANYARVFDEGLAAALLSVAEGEAPVNPYLQSTEGTATFPLDPDGWAGQ